MSNLSQLGTTLAVTSVLLASLVAQGPVPLADINQSAPHNFGSDIGNDYANLSGFTYFSASSVDKGNELWRTTGLGGSGVQLVKDIMPGEPDSSPKNLVTFGSQIYFQAQQVTNPAVGVELWRTDGTAAGTALFVDLNQGAGGSNFEQGTVVGGLLFFVASDYTNGTELWVTDGTVQGTRMVKDIATGWKSSKPNHLKAMAGKLYFTAQSTSGTELWVSDGTAAGTMGFDIYPGPPSGNPNNLGVVGNKLFFGADDGMIGKELWVIDSGGTGPRLVKDLRPGSNSTHASPLDFQAFGSKVLFSAEDGVHGRELWISDGTSTGTFMVLDINPSANGLGRTAFVAHAGQMLFTADDGFVGRELWVTDGTAAGTQLVIDLEPGPNGSGAIPRASRASGVLFTAFSGPQATDNEVWVTDLTTTLRLKDINPGTLSSKATSFFSTPAGVTLFEADDGTRGLELWSTDGTSMNTSLFADIFAPAPGASRDDDINGTFDAFGKTYFVADDGVHGAELWTTDGTPTGTVMLKDISLGLHGSRPSDFFTVNGKLVFMANTGLGVELWATDGTRAGTKLVIDLIPGNLAPHSSDFCQLGNKLYFSAYGPTGQYGLFETDGTAAGTKVVAHLRVASNPTSYRKIVSMGGKLYFPATDSRGYELWVSDGTAAGTTLLKDIASLPGFSGLSDKTQLTVFGDKIFFAATDGSANLEPWVSDGTAAGTLMLKDISPGTSPSRPIGAAAWNDKVFFTAYDLLHGRELWVSDGTRSGTHLVKDIWSGSRIGVRDLSVHAVLPQGLLFVADDGVSGQELWMSDGTSGGTYLVKDIQVGDESSQVYDLFATGSRKAYFSARSIAHGTELWVTDGTTGGSNLVADIMPMRGSSSPRYLALSGGKLYFRARHPLTGERLFVLDPGASVATVGHAHGSSVATPTLTATDPVIGGVMTTSGTHAEGASVLVMLGAPSDALVYAGGDLSFFVSNPVFITTQAVSGNWSSSFPVPVIPQLKGVTLATQALIAPTSNQLGVSSTKGLHLTFGK